MSMDKNALAALPLEELLRFAKNAAKRDAAPQASCGPEDELVTQPVLSFAQERLWFMDRLSPLNPFYNIPFNLEITGRLDREALAGAWEAVIARHGCLRSRFPADADGRPCVDALPPERLALRTRDMAAMDPEDQRRLLDEAARREAATGFDLDSGPLLRGTLIRRGEELHSLLATFHHIVFDGWSVGIFYKDLFTAYDDIRRGRAPQTGHAAPTYEQYAQWQRRRMTPGYVDTELAWWTRQLGDAPDLRLWTDAPRPEVQSFTGGAVEFTIPQGTAQQMELVARRHKATPFMAWLAVFSLMLSRFSGQTDFNVGCSLAGRDHPATEGIIGFFLNNLVVRSECTRNMPFCECLAQLRDTVLRSMEHADLPFQLVAGALDRGRGLDRNPLYQAGFTYQNTPPLDIAPGGLSLRSVMVPVATTHVDVELFIWPEPDGLRCHLVHATDIIGEARARKMTRMLAKMAETFSQRPHTPIHDVPAPEKPSILHGPGLRHEFLPPWQRLERLREAKGGAAALLRPGQDGGRDAAGDISMDGLALLVESMAARLAAMGVAPGGTVGILLHPGPMLIAAMLAAWRQGCAWVPLDPDHPAAMNQWIVCDSGCCCVVSEAVSWEAHRAATDADTPACLTEQPCGPVPAPASAPPPQSPACLLYTSGSTGRPKGIVLSHEAVNTRLCWMWQALPWEAGDVACQKTSPCFVDFLWETFGAVLAGVPLVLPGPKPARDMDRLLAVMREHRVTHMVLVPSLLSAMHEAGPGLGNTAPSLRVILSSGEPLPPKLVRKTRAALPGVRVFNLYGSTEVMDATWHEASEHDAPSVPIGIPIDGTTAAVLDEALRPVPRGETGVLHVCGPCVGHGYLGAAKERGAMFRPPQIPGLETPEGRWFRMGDQVSLGEDGLLRYHGRQDRQIKIRGVRMEPAAIGAVLARHPSVKEAVAAARPGPDGADRLVAYILPHAKDAPPDSAQLAQTLRPWVGARLPAAMVPDLFVPVAAWPRTPSGKINVRELPVVPVMPAATAPATPVEADILDVWRAALETDAIGVRDNFFEVGGTSLLVVSVHERLQRRLDKRFPLTVLFQNPTVESLAAWLGAGVKGQSPQPSAASRALQRERAKERRSARHMA